MGASITPRDVTALIPSAHLAMRGTVYRTPLESSAWLSAVTSGEVLLKLECYQQTGSFKLRGAMAALSVLSPDERLRGVITASAGNHGLGIAAAAQRLGISATIVLPEEASSAKVALLRRFPVQLLKRGGNFDEAERAARRLSHETGAVYVSAYNDLHVIAGQGTVGIELLEDAPDLDVIVMPAGGGGLVVGIGSWIKAVQPGVRIVAIQSESSPALLHSLRAGHLVETDVLPSLADGISGNIEPGSMTFDLARKVVDEVVLVSEEEIAWAIRETYHELHLALEGSAVVPIAALLGGKVSGVEGKRTALVLTGRNIAAQRLQELLRSDSYFV